MAKAQVIVDYRLILSERYEEVVKIYHVGKSKKYPDGYKVRCALLDIQNSTIRLLLDNHEPFGYHIHTDLPLNKDKRVSVKVTSYKDAVAVLKGT